ncbi:hypothetical protein QR680_012261 [Steinernema hermaphroditum]|uniref:Uncharacterized protein n=1 Tax=Steinernema hermaphroditum TaxID=289476 RepID=A0AA39I326_9BILA|nr:hypothetical protein QR680_012261 [Steinernema hermaphroditum]
MLHETYLTIMALSYCSTFLLSYVAIKTCTKKTRHFTYYVLNIIVHHSLITLLLTLFLQPEFLEEVLCFRIHGVVTLLPSSAINFFLTITVALVATTFLSYVHISLYHLLSLRHRSLSAMMCSPKCFPAVCVVYVISAAMTFCVVYVSLYFETQDSSDPRVICFQAPFSSIMTLFGAVFVGVVTLVGLATIGCTVSVLHKSQTSIKKDIRGVMKSLVIFALIPISMVAVPLCPVLVWSALTQRSSSFAITANFCVFVATFEYTVMTCAAILLIRPYNRATRRLVRLVVRRCAIVGVEQCF